MFFSYIRTDTSEESTLTIPVGNVTEGIELTYEFGVRKGFNLNSPPQDGMLAMCKYLPKLVILWVLLCCLPNQQPCLVFVSTLAMHHQACGLGHLSSKSRCIVVLVSFSDHQQDCTGEPGYQITIVYIDTLDNNCCLHTLICIGVPYGASKRSGSPLVISGKVHLPFQLQIRYTDQDGSRCMRVSTFAKPVTSNKETVERGEIYMYYALQK